MGMIYEFNLIHDVHFKVMPTKEKATFMEQARKHSAMYQQQLEKSLANQEKDEVEMICMYV
jgi:hypothetical protein